MPNEVWTCPKCNRGMAPGMLTCDHGGKPCGEIDKERSWCYQEAGQKMFVPSESLYCMGCGMRFEQATEVKKLKVLCRECFKKPYIIPHDFSRELSKKEADNA